MLDKVKIELEIEAIEMKITSYEAMIWTEEKEQELINDAIGICTKYKKGREREIDAVKSEIRKKLTSISSYSNFAKTYQNDTNQILNGELIQQAFIIVDAIINKLRVYLKDSIEKTDYYTKQIDSLYRKIEELKKSLDSLEE